MARFSYRAIDRKGRASEDEIDAESLEDAARHLISQGLQIARLEEVRERQGFSLLFFARKARKDRFRVFFYRQLALLLRSGMPLAWSVKLLADGEDGWRGDLLRDMYTHIEGGGTLPTALERHGDVFDKMTQGIVRAGDASGTLDVVLERLASYAERSYRLEEKLKTIVSYPIVLLALTTLASLFFLLYVLPSFQALFHGLELELPLPTRMLLYVSHMVESAGIYLVPFLLAVVVGVYGLSRWKPWMRRWSRWRLRLPVFGILEQHIELERVFGTLSLLMASGLVLHEALRLVEQVSGNFFLEEVLGALAEKVHEGDTLSSAIEYGVEHDDFGHGLFPVLVVEWVKTGEATGDMARALEELASYFSFAGDMYTKRVEALAEPVLILIVGAVIGLFVLSVALPLFEMLSAFS